MSESKNKKAITVAFALGFELIGLVLVGIFVGEYIEKSSHNGFSSNKGAIVGCVLAFTVWFWRLMKTRKHML